MDKSRCPKGKLFVMTMLVALFVLVAFLVMAPKGVDYTEKTPFEGVYPTSQQRIYIEFKGVWLKRAHLASLLLGSGNIKMDVWVKPSALGLGQIVVNIDPRLSGTVLSVTPNYESRLFSPFVSVIAEKIAIWVATDEEKLQWERWVRESEESYFAYQHKERAQPSLKKIIPLLD